MKIVHQLPYFHGVEDCNDNSPCRHLTVPYFVHFVSFILGEQADLGNRGAGGGLDNPQTDLVGGGRIAADEPAVADARALGELGPLAVLPLIQRELLDALAER